jgi:phosphate-selective porin OprO/OprP
MLALALMTSAADAQQGDTSRQLQTLQDQMRTLQQQLDALKAADVAQKEALAKETATREAAEKAARDAAVEAGGTLVLEGGRARVRPPANPMVTQSGTNRFTMSSADGQWTIAPTGRIHFDFGTYLNQSPDGVTGPGTVAGGKLSSGVNARRARLGVTGKAWNDFTYSLILDAGGATDGTAAINTASIGYTGIPNTIVEMGYMAQFFTLEEATSSNDVTFIERSSPTTIASSFNAGDPRASAGFRTWGPDWWFGAYFTSSTPNVAHALTKRGFGAYQRATYNVINDPLQTLHIGVGVAEIFQAPNTGPNTAQSFTLSDRPEIRIDPTTILNTGALGTVANPVTGATVYAGELAATSGSFFFKSEYFRYDVSRRGKSKANLMGTYAEASYTFGGRRGYTANCGCYSGINPITPFSPVKGGNGAVELAARVSYTDLIDDYTSNLTAAAQPNLVNGGRQLNYTLGVNWYWNSNMLWKFNYVRTAYNKANPITATNLTPTRLGLDVDTLAARFQVMF